MRSEPSAVGPWAPPPSGWRSEFARLSPAYDQFCPEVLGALARHQVFPPVAAWAAELPRAQRAVSMRFVEQDEKAIKQAGGYDFFIRAERAVPSRPESWHDLFNALVWLHYPQLKLGIHQLQLEDFSRREQPGKRTALGDVATQLDECGVLVLSSDPSLHDDLRELRWRQLFFERRAELLQNMRFLVVGHALLHALIEPYIGLMGRALLIDAPQASLATALSARCFVDEWAPSELPRRVQRTRDLYPLPLLGIPDYVANDSAAFYDGLPEYFRARRAAPMERGERGAVSERGIETEQQGD
ncbi:MAG: DUF3025 domain-containing protein [Polyangiaceae bacterium]|nr:DUF3025 domain-containing protein [Polyangiaceae bacterium]